MAYDQAVAISCNTSWEIYISCTYISCIFLQIGIWAKKDVHLPPQIPSSDTVNLLPSTAPSTALYCPAFLISCHSLLTVPEPNSSRPIHSPSPLPQNHWIGSKLRKSINLYIVCTVCLIYEANLFSSRTQKKDLVIFFAIDKEDR